MIIPELRKKLDRLLNQYQHAKVQVVEETARLEAAEEGLDHAKTAQQILQAVAETIQTQAQIQIARVVSRCLSAVFEEPYSLQIEFDRKRGKTEASFVYHRNGNKVDPLVTSGGVLEVTAFALRLASLVMTMPPCRRLLCIDEGLSGLDGNNARRMASLLLSLATELDMQIIMVTHRDDLAIGRVLRLSHGEVEEVSRG